MLTRVNVEKIDNGVYIGLTDHTATIYKNTLGIVSKLVKTGYQFTSINPYGSIIVETDNYESVVDCVKNYLEEEEYIESIEKNTRCTVFNMVE